MIETIATFLASFVVALVTGLIAYFKTSQRSAAQREYNKQQQEALYSENTKLQGDMRDLKAVVEDLRTQVTGLQHFKELYETLKEAHTRLKEDHEALRKDFQDKLDSWNSIKQDLEREHSLALSLQAEVERLRQELLLKDNEVKTFEKAMTMLGCKLAEGDEEDGSA